LQIQAPDYESLLDILSAAGQDDRLVLFIEGLMFRQIAMDGDRDSCANALLQSSQMWQSLYQSLQCGVIFVKRRASFPSFKLPPRPQSPKERRGSHKNSVAQLLRGGRSSIDLNNLGRHSSWSMGMSLGVPLGAEGFAAKSRRSSVVGVGLGSSAGSSRRGSTAIGGDERAVAAFGTAAQDNQASSSPITAAPHLQRRRSIVEVPP
jgi:hypothetical protein